MSQQEQPSKAQALDQEATFKAAMSQFPSGVTVITTHSASGEPVGMTASAFISVSLNPPLVLESVAKTAQMHAHLSEQPRYAVSILSAGQAPVSNHFAGWGAEGYQPPLSELGGLPTIEGSLARLACPIVQRVDAGDHTLFIARVDEAELEQGDQDPLIYAKRGYHTLTSTSQAQSSQAQTSPKGER